MHYQQPKKSWFRAQWDRWTPAIQILGFVIAVSFGTGVYFSQFTAVAATVDKDTLRIALLEDHYAHIEQRLNDLCEWLKVPRRN